MMADTSIQWCDHSINPIRARNKATGAVGHYCEKVAAGCTSCYSSAFQKRFGMPPFGASQHRDEVEIFLDESKLEEVRRRKKPTKYFWEDMSDIFGGWMQSDWLDACFATMDATPQHTHLLLTKRPENVRWMWPDCSRCNGNGRIEMLEHCPVCLGSPYRRNVWIGTSISTQADADRNIPELLKLRDLSPVLFVSAEPLLEEIDLVDISMAIDQTAASWNVLSGTFAEYGPPEQYWFGPEEQIIGTTASIDWMIIGGESGPNARPCDVAWIRSLRDQAQAAGVATFIKQVGSCPKENGRRVLLRTLGGSWHYKDRCDDPKGGDWNEWPKDLRVREFPQPRKDGEP